MKLRIEKSVVVITPTIGSPKLVDAVESIRNQTYGNVQHLIVADGMKYLHTVNKLLLEQIGYTKGMELMFLPWNTGANGFNGQRIYASVPHLVDHDYVFFLDQDNWYKPDHIETMVETMEKYPIDFAYSLREVFTEDKSESVLDNCESLGKWPIFFTIGKREDFLIDTSAFGFKKDFIQRTCHLYHSGAWGEDRRYLATVKPFARFECTGKYSLNYRTGGNKGSVQFKMFDDGNKITASHYKDGYPWAKT